MYAIYSRQVENGQTRLKFSNEISLAGRNNGLIPKLLREKLLSDSNPPVGWILSIADDFNKKNQSVIIDIKPKSKSEIVLCELDMVFGFSYNEWSPIMYRLRQLYNDLAEDIEINKEDFVYPSQLEIIYTMSYFAGSFKSGQMSGTWSPPGPSATNSLLLWPGAMTFFYNQIKKYDPKFLDKNIDIIK